jgi:hypothetical protein
MYDKDFAKLFVQILIKEKGVCYTDKKPIVIMDISKELNSNRRYPFIQKAQFFYKTQTLWVKKLKGSGIKIFDSKVPGSKKITADSKSIVVMSKNDFDKLGIKQKPLLTYTPKGKTIFSMIVRYNKKEEVHIDTPSAKIAGRCGLNGILSVGKDYAKENKSLALVNYKWLKDNPIDEVDCIWSDPFAKMLFAMGLLLP